ncbi:MAG TPA: hypothetical protein PLJ23_11190, partial [Gemmatimonadales bacterium]|nr:hypothetical protein [Gemmatimonadales bacterium]
GIEPDFALVKFKKLAGGGYFKIVNASVERALGRLGYSKAQIAEILAYVVGTNTFLGAPVVNREYLKGKGFTNEDITRLEGQLPGAFTVEGVFSAFGLGADLCKRLGLEEAAKAPGWNLLAHWGLTRAQIDLLGDPLLGRVTVEGAPVTVIDPSAAVLASPNTITTRDFDGWIQDRTLYMPRTFDPAYKPVLEMNDPGEAPNRGAILVAPYGKGTYVYTTLAFFRQLPNGNPGAARLMINLLSARAAVQP